MTHNEKRYALCVLGILCGVVQLPLMEFVCQNLNQVWVVFFIFTPALVLIEVLLAVYFPEGFDNFLVQPKPLTRKPR